MRAAKCWSGHEDDAQRAVQTGLGIVEAIGTLNTRLEQVQGIRLAAPLRLYRVVQESGVQSRLEATMVRGLMPLVGREAEVILLLV